VAILDILSEQRIIEDGELNIMMLQADELLRT
jgi:hypothetical protein